MILVIARRELRSLFLSPLAWTILAVVQVILAFMFFAQIDLYLQLQPRLALMPAAPGITEMIVAPLFANAAIVLLLVVPLLTMRLISEERRSQTLSLLFSAPVSMLQIVLGKYLGVMLFLLLQLLLIDVMAVSLTLGGSIDFGVLASCSLGLALLLASCAALGLYLSALTAQPVIAAIASMGLLLLLWVLQLSNGVAETDGGNALSYLSLSSHYQPMLRGIVSSVDVIYFLLLVVTCLILSKRRLDADRLQS